MRTYDDTFSGQKIYPGKVRTLQCDQAQEWGDAEVSWQQNETMQAIHHRLHGKITSLSLMSQDEKRWVHIEWAMEETERHGGPKCSTVADNVIRASSSSARTVRSSVSKMASPSHSFSSARIHAASPGPSSAVDKGGRASLRCASPPCTWAVQGTDGPHRSKPRPVVAAKLRLSVPSSVHHST